MDKIGTQRVHEEGREPSGMERTGCHFSDDAPTVNLMTMDEEREREREKLYNQITQL